MLEYFMKHEFRQFPGIGVVARAMVAIGQDQSIGKPVPCAVSELKDTLAFVERRQDGPMSETAEG